MERNNADIDLLFRKTLKEIWHKVQNLVNFSSGITTKSLILKEIALDFYNQFVNTSIPVIKDQYFFENYYSVIIPLENSCISIPYKFYILAELVPLPHLDPLFDMQVNWKVFLTYFYEKIFNIKQTLLESDVKIIKVLTQFTLSANKKRLPYTKEEIAYKAECIGKRLHEPMTKVTVARRIKYLINQNILTEYLLINPWSLGYKIYLFMYEKTQDEFVREWDKWTIFKQYLMDNHIFRVVRIPQHAEGELIIPKSIQKTEIKKIFISNNVSKLEADPNKSFLQTPGFETSKLSNYHYVEFFDKEDENWIQSLYDMADTDSTSEYPKYSSINRLKKENRINTGFKFLSFVAREGSIKYPIENSAKRAGIERNIFDNFFKFFIEKEVLLYSTRILYIGCNIRLGIMICSLEKSIQEHEILRNFINNLLELPYAYTFIADYTIATYINLPSAWVGDFMSYLSILSTNQDLII